MRVKIRIQIPMILKTINTLKNYVSSRTFNNEKPIEVAISSKNFAFYATSHTNAFVLVVSDVMCVFSAETEF